MKFVLNYLQGILIGSGAILPGISSGVFCVIFGIYEKLINSILNLFHDFKKNFIFLFPICLGGITGILLVSKLLNLLLNIYPIPTKFCFLGLILGSIPVLFKQANQPKGFRLHYLTYLLATFFIGFLSIKLETILPNFINLNNTQQIHFFYLVFAGFLMSIGIIVPGISSSVILTTLGIYNIYINAIANMNFYILIPLGIGVLVRIHNIFKSDSIFIKSLLYSNFLFNYWLCTRFYINSLSWICF